jgi:hypothetical protein
MYLFLVVYVLLSTGLPIYVSRIPPTNCRHTSPPLPPPLRHATSQNIAKYLSLDYNTSQSNATERIAIERSTTNINRALAQYHFKVYGVVNWKHSALAFFLGKCTLAVWRGSVRPRLVRLVNHSFE